MTVIAGDIAFLGINSTNPDQFAILAVRAIAGGDIFFVTDGGFTGSNTGVANTTFRGTEGFLQYTAPVGGIAAGSVLMIQAGDGVPANASVARNGGGAAGTVSLLTNGTNATNFTFSTSGDQLTAYTVSSGTYLTGAPVLVAFIDIATNPYGTGSANTSSIPTITGGQVLDLANIDNAIFTDAANAATQSIAALSNSANFSTRETTVYDLTTLTSYTATTASLSVNAVAIAEGNAGTSLLTFTVTRSTNTNAFTVDVATANGTATAGSDYVAGSTTLSFTAGGALTQDFAVTINGDTTAEANETFAVNLSNVVATLGGATIGTQGQGTINDDDATTASLSVNAVAIAEGNAGTSLLTFTVTRSTNTNAFTVDLATANGTATAGSDYVAGSTTLSFTAGGALTQDFAVTINGDTTIEANETFAVNLSNVVATLGGATIGTQGQGTINNDDSTVTQLSAGDADRDSAVLIAKASQAGSVSFQVATDAGFSNIVVNQNVLVSDPMTPAKLVLSDGALTAGTQYFWRATDALGATASASFRTADTDGVRNGFSMGVTGDWRGELAPYPAIKNAATAGLDLFIKLGDTIYADYPSPALNQPQALTLSDYLIKHNEVYSAVAGLDAWGDLQATTAILATIDDHEVINDFAGGELASADPRFGESTGLVNDTQLYENGLTAFTAYNAIEDRTYADTGLAPLTDGERDLYRYSLQGQDAAIFVLDARSFRDAELAPVANITDPAQIANFLVASATQDRTMLGDAQLTRLKADLLDAQARGVVWKFIQVPEPIQNFGVLGAEDRFEGYAVERTELLRFINDNALTGVVFVAADIHGTVVNNLTYQEFPGGPQIAVAAWEITTGSVAFDAPFGQTVAALAGAAGLLTPQQSAFYNSLPVAPDTDSALNDRDDFIKSLINQQVTALGYDPIGLNTNLAQTNGLIDATLVTGDYLVTHGYGWTRFDVDATSGDLTVTTYAVPYYSAAEAAANPATVAALTPTVQAQFTVRATINETITGTASGETLDGGAGNDTISGLAGNDSITGGYGNDVIDGGDGLDIAIFQGNRAAATISNTGLGSWTVTTANGGTDTLTRIEQLQFADGLYGGATLGANSGIDLSIYRLVARYDLPEPTSTTPPTNSLLAQEASAVTYNWDTDTLFIVGDGSTSVVQVSRTGQLINSMTLAPGSSPQGTEFYDLEGITYVGNGVFVMAEERDRQLVQFTYVADTTLTRANAQTVKLGTTIGNVGFEGLSWDPQTQGFIVVKEITPQSVFQTTVDFANGTASNGSPTATGSTNLFDPALAGLTDIADVFALSNLTALGGLTQSGNILLLSQEDGRIVNIDRAGNIASSLTIASPPGNPLTVADQGHEGLTVGADGTLYIVSENGGGDSNSPQLWVYQPSALPNAAPTAVALTGAVTTLAENTSTTARLKVADITITDDGIGNNALSLTGVDAAFFEIAAGSLYIRAGTVLDFETRSSYAVTVNVDDTSIGATPDATAGYSLTLTDVVNENPTASGVSISEVAPWSSGNSPVAADWFEVTNNTGLAIDITGWRFDDNSALATSALTLTGVTSIAAGQSVIFIETGNGQTASGNAAAFVNTWFNGTAPAGLVIGSYSGPGAGLGTGGDQVNLYNAANVLQASVTFGASPASAPFGSFDNATGLNNTTISTLSANGVNGAFFASGGTTEIGSPGQAAANPLLIVGTFSAETLNGTAGNDTIIAAAGADTVNGGAGNDLLNGGDGDDLLQGGLGADSLFGGAGFDSATYASATAALTVRLDFANLNSGEAAGDTHTGIERIIGSTFSDTLVGTTGSQTLVGNGGNDVFIGRQGADLYVGGAGQDFFAFAFEDFEAGIYDVIQNAGQNDWFVTADVVRETILALAYQGGVVVTIPTIGFGLTGGGFYIENFALSDFWNQLYTL